MNSSSPENIMCQTKVGIDILSAYGHFHENKENKEKIKKINSNSLSPLRQNISNNNKKYRK